MEQPANWAPIRSPRTARQALSILAQPLTLCAQERVRAESAILAPRERGYMEESLQFLLDENGGRGNPDEKIGRNGRTYMERWHILPKRIQGPNLYLHRILRDDPEDLHDHPWHSASWILQGALEETCKPTGAHTRTETRIIRANPEASTPSVIRTDQWCHRLRIAEPKDIPPVTLFATGNQTRNWGFWTDPKTFIDHVTWEREHGS